MSTKKRTPKSDKTIAFLESITQEKLSFSNSLISIRKGEEMSQTEFANVLGVSRQYLCDVEHGRRRVSPKIAAEWANKLGYSVLQFVRLALQAEIEKAGLPFEVQVRAAA